MERLKSSSKYEIIKTTKRDGYYYSSGEFEYTPPGWVRLEQRWYPLGFRVLTNDLKSLGLRGNTTILTYKIGEWTKLQKSQLIFDDVDEGGIFSGVSLSAARKTQESCRNRQRNPFETRVFYAAILNPFLSNSYKVKSQGLMLLEELR